MRLFDRRYDPVAAKESTQRRISFYVIWLVASVICVICYKGTLDDIKNLYNTLLPFFGLVLGFWIGSSKGAADNREQLNKMMPAPMAASGSDGSPLAPIQTDEVKIDAQTATVTEAKS